MGALMVASTERCGEFDTTVPVYQDFSKLNREGWLLPRPEEKPLNRAN
jgi:hypothetical protein